MPRNKRNMLETVYAMYPDATCELDYRTNEELAIAVILSAQTTDISVNKVTPVLFGKFPTIQALAEADEEAIADCIRTIGLYRNKAKNIKRFAEQLIKEYDGLVPSDAHRLKQLSGVGQKTANVIQAVAFKIPAIAVDTHVHRVSLRLGLVKENSSVVSTETQLKKLVPESEWIQAHHALLFFGRYHCTAMRPKCDVCPLKDACRYYQKELKFKIVEKKHL